MGVDALISLIQSRIEEEVRYSSDWDAGRECSLCWSGWLISR